MRALAAYANMVYRGWMRFWALVIDDSTTAVTFECQVFNGFPRYSVEDLHVVLPRTVYVMRMWRWTHP